MTQQDEYGYMQWEPSDYFHTFGGEAWLEEDSYLNEYGLDFSGAIAIEKIPASEMIKIGTTIINHLMICGHRFEIKNDHNGEFLELKTKV
jgi:hypothetical protein